MINIRAVARRAFFLFMVFIFFSASCSNDSDDAQYNTNWELTVLDNEELTIESYDSIRSVNVEKNMDIDSSGNIHIVYYDVENEKFKYLSNTSGQWFTSILDSNLGLSSTLSSEWGSSMTIDALDNVHISYYDIVNGDLKYIKITSEQWIISVLDSEGDVGRSNSVIVDDLNNVHIIYSDETNKTVKYMTNATGEWASEIIDNGDSPTFGMDSQNYIHIGYNHPSDHISKYATNKGGNWEVSDFEWEGGRPRLKIDSNGNVHILNTVFSIWFNYVNDTSGFLELKTNYSSGRYVGDYNFDLDSNNTLHIAFQGYGYLDYYMGESPLYHEWYSAFSVPSLALDSSDHAHMAFIDVSGGGHLIYLTNSSGDWTKEIVANRVTSPASALIDSDDIFHMCYNDDSGWLIYAKRKD